MTRTFSSLLLFSAISVAWPALALDSGPGVRAEPKVQREAATRGVAKAGQIRSAHARPVRLGAPPSAAAQLAPPSKGAPLHVGFGRDVDALRDEARTAAALDWTRLDDGSHVAALRVTSAEALSLRAALRVASLPANAVVRFQAPGAAEVFEFSGAEIAEVLALNAAAGEKGPDALLYWSPLIEGDTILIEVEIPGGVDPRGVKLAVPHVSHLLTSAARDFVVVEKASASCQVDAMCSAATWGSQMNAVARMVFTSGGGTFVCTGTLLADQDSASNVPYFLSANHCISSQTAASSLATMWFYRSAACNATTVGSSRQLSGGATLLHATSGTDTSFLRLNNTPPEGAVYAGWFVGTTPGPGTAATGLHHPRGDWLKISTGVLSGYLSCTAPSSGTFSCNGASASNGTYYSVGWTQGITEPGSSGSGLFRSDGLLVGQLYGGGSDCSGSGSDIYGRFDVAYRAALSGWLSGYALSVSKSGTGSGRVTSAPAGIDCGLTCAATYSGGTFVTLTAAPSAGSVFTGWSGSCSGTGSCAIPMNGAKSVTASFAAATSVLTVTTSGLGTVTSSPAGIDCGSTCSANFVPGTVVTLNAAPGRGLTLTGWGGACSGGGSCTVTMNGSVSVSASFGNRSASTTTLASTPNPSLAGQPVTFTATVAGSTQPPTGSVAFVADGTPILGCVSQPVVAGAAVCTTSALAVGSRSIVATYSGDAAYSGSSSAALAQSVQGTTTASSSVSGLSSRVPVLTGDGVVIAGFVIGGSTSKTVVVRARGPSLIPLGITSAVPDPMLQLVRMADQATIATNDNWGTNANAAQISSAGLAPSDPREAAVMMTLAPGAYTAIVTGVGGTGVGIVEVFEVDHPESPLLSISTRGYVLTGSDLMIGGFVIQGDAPRTVMIRGRGPSLAQFRVPNVLANPMLQLVRMADQAVIATNDDWGASANAAQISASGLAPTNALEAAILVTLEPGAYTAIVSGAAGGTGIGIVEVIAQ